MPALLATVQAPSQVMSQLPLLHTTLEPVPTVCVHDLPTQVTLQDGPQLPVQVALASQSSRQDAVEALQPSKAQVSPEGQSQLVPAQTV